MWGMIGVFEVVLVLIAVVLAVTTGVPALRSWFGTKAKAPPKEEPWFLGVCFAVATRRHAPVFAVRLLTLLAIMVTGVVPGLIVYLLMGVFLDQWILAIPPSSTATGDPFPSTSPAQPRSTTAHDRIGRYRITAVIGRGGMGTVYRGRDDALNRDAAVKVLHPRFADETGPASRIVERFAEEARSIARLTSPHVVQIYEFEPQATPPYLAMEFVDGPSLQQLLHEKPQLSPAATADCGRQVLIGLAAAHAAGIIHRDVKPANILRAADGTYKLTDFGLARSFERAENLTMTGTLLGTVSYLAPEVACGDEATAASDLYSLGVTLYQMLTGKTPFGDASPLKLLRQIAGGDLPPLADVRDDVPAVFTAWLTKLLARDPAERFASATAALAALNAVGIAQPASHEFAHTPSASAQPTPLDAPFRETERWIPRRDVDSILRTAMRMESEGESLVGERSVLEIARELGVDTALVRTTLQTYQTLAKPSTRNHAPHNRHALSGDRQRTIRWLFLIGVISLAIVLLTSLIGMRPGSPSPEFYPADVIQIEPVPTMLSPQRAPPPTAAPAAPRIILLDSDASDDGNAASD